MKFFFDPASIAAVGASPRPWGSNLMANILNGYKGIVYPVNPNYKEIAGLVCYSSVENVPGPVDLAIILMPAPKVPAVLESCARKGVKGVILESGGFAEVGAEGKALQERCVEIAKKSGMRLWGPNCLGLVDIPGRKFFTFTFTRIFEPPLLSGRVSLVVQSGALAGVFLPELMNRRGIGLSKVCSIGNKADIDECDILEYLFEDEQTDGIGLYLEAIPRARLFLELVSRSPKPIAVLMAGSTESGARAAMSHTASLAGDARLMRSLLGGAGVELADDFHQMVDLARTLAIARRLPPGCRTAVLTPSGASASLSCDLLEQHGLKAARLSPSTRRALAGLFPPWMPPDHPVDVGPAVNLTVSLAAVTEQAAEILLQDPNVDLLLVHYFFIETQGLNIKKMKETADRTGKILAFWGVGFQEEVRKFQLEAQTLEVLVYDELFRATECLAAAARYRRPEPLSPRIRVMRKSTGRPEMPPAPNETRQPEIKDEYESKRLLAAWGIPVVKERLVTDLSQALAAAEELGFPLVLKGLPPGIIHKSELGLVQRDIVNPSQLTEAYANVRHKMAGRGRIVVQPKLKIDYELIAGFLQDKQFGPCVMIGLGGLFAELQPDIAFALAPLNKKQALRLLSKIRAQKLFDGYRGLKPLDRVRTAGLLVNLGHLGTSLEGVKQIDINPIVVTGGLPVVVDATLITDPVPSAGGRNQRSLSREKEKR